MYITHTPTILNIERTPHRSITQSKHTRVWLSMYVPARVLYSFLNPCLLRTSVIRQITSGDCRFWNTPIEIICSHSSLVIRSACCGLARAVGVRREEHIHTSANTRQYTYQTLIHTQDVVESHNCVDLIQIANWWGSETSACPRLWLGSVLF